MALTIPLFNQKRCGQGWVKWESVLGEICFAFDNFSVGELWSCRTDDIRGSSRRGAPHCRGSVQVVFFPVLHQYCETQPPASIGWVALSSVVLLFVVPHPSHLLSSSLYDVSDHTNHIFSVRIWSWQHVSLNISCIHCWVEPSLLLYRLFSLDLLLDPGVPGLIYGSKCL